MLKFIIVFLGSAIIHLHNLKLKTILILYIAAAPLFNPLPETLCLNSCLFKVPLPNLSLL